MSERTQFKKKLKLVSKAYIPQPSTKSKLSNKSKPVQLFNVNQNDNSNYLFKNEFKRLNNYGDIW